MEGGVGCCTRGYGFWGVANGDGEVKKGQGRVTILAVDGGLWLVVWVRNSVVGGGKPSSSAKHRSVRRSPHITVIGRCKRKVWQQATARERWGFGDGGWGELLELPYSCPIPSFRLVLVPWHGRAHAAHRMVVVVHRGGVL